MEKGVEITPGKVSDICSVLAHMAFIGIHLQRSSKILQTFRFVIIDPISTELQHRKHLTDILTHKLRKIQVFNFLSNVSS